MSSGIITGNVKNLCVVTVTFDAANMTDTADVKEQTFTVPGAKTTDTCFVCKVGHLDGIANANAYISAADTLSLELVNPTAGALNLSSMDYRVLIVRTDNVATAFTG